MKERLAVEAEAVGFSRMRVTTPDAVPQLAERLQQFLDAGRHGQMGWMAERTHWRGNPAAPGLSLSLAYFTLSMMFPLVSRVRVRPSSVTGLRLFSAQA